MTTTVTLPLWLLVLILLFAVVTFASHFLFPSVRWFFRRRAEKVIARLNKRLARPIEPFKLARRFDMIERLVYDPAVVQAVIDHAAQERVPERVAVERARRYAREIVPSFSATLYFGVGARLARWLSRTMYRLRLGAFDRASLEGIDPNASVVFVMNHRSNMDYVLVTYLISRASALSYAVGEWARIWPLSGIIRTMGAYFIRRRYKGELYNRVLERYVQFATAGGVTQAIFPEGGLSLTGELGKPKLGLLSYIIKDWAPGKRDVIFVPVALNYDRVLEDTFLIAAAKSGERRFRAPLGQIISVAVRHIWQRVTLRLKPFGTASVSFGEPLELSQFIVSQDGVAPTEALAEEIFRRINQVMPIVPVPLVSRFLLEGQAKGIDALTQETEAALKLMAQRGNVLPRRDARTLVTDAIALLEERKLVVMTSDGFVPLAEKRDVLGFYAASIAHHFEALGEVATTEQQGTGPWLEPVS